MASRDAEDSVYQAASAGLKRWLQRARSAVMAPWTRFKATPNPAAIASTVPVWQAEVDRILAALTPALKEGWAAAHLPHEYDPNDPYIQANLALTKNLLVRVPDEMHAKVVKEILEGTNAGESTADIARRVDQVLDYEGQENWPDRARLIAQTECFPGDTLVSGAVTSAYRRWYEGDLVTIWTQKGYRLTGTPNHPVLTPCGWKRIGDLLESDELVCHQGSIQDSLVPRNPNIETRPTSLAQAFDSIKAIGFVSRVRGRKPDFNGDGFDSDVEIVSINRSLPYSIGEFPLYQDLKVLLEGPASTFSPLEHNCTCSSVSLGLSDLSRRSHVTQGNTVVLERPTERSGADSQFESQGCRRLSTKVLGSQFFNVQGFLDNFRTWLSEALSFRQGPTWNASVLQGSIHQKMGASSQPSHGERTHPSQVVIDQVVQREVTAMWRGHVYDLTTSQGFFTANGIVVKNCTRHRNSSTLAHALLVEKQDKRELHKRWDTTMDNRERAAHRFANGQTRPLGQPFDVEGVSMLYPGDPAAPPSLVCNCRCDLGISAGPAAVAGA